MYKSPMNSSKKHKRTPMNSSKKHKRTPIKKIKVYFNQHKILGETINMYFISLPHFLGSCKNKLNLKTISSKARRKIYKTMKLQNYIRRHKKCVNIIPINKHTSTRLLETLINKNTTYTYCLTKSTLVLSETITPTNDTLIKDLMSKHILLCNENPCASGEMHIDKDTFVFNNNSGSYKPGNEHLERLQKSLPFLKLKIENINNV